MTPPRLEKAFAESWPPAAWTEVTVVAAVSGGADSVALARAMTAMKSAGPGRLVVAHFNHQFRGEESDGDEKFVKQLAEELGVGFRSGRLDVDEIAGSEGIEEAARAARYRFLTETAEELGARYLVLAHTADDQIETVLHRIIRGTGIAGLAGIPRCRRLSEAVTLIRPLLGVRRGDVVEYLASLGQGYREDRSNRDQRFTRNRIRHDLLPHLAEVYNPMVGEALLRLGALARECQSVVEGLVRQMVSEGALVESGDGWMIDRARVSEQPDYLVRELIIHAWQSREWPMQSMGYEEWNALLSMVRNDPELAASAVLKRTFPGRIQAECGADGLHLFPDGVSCRDCC